MEYPQEHPLEYPQQSPLSTQHRDQPATEWQTFNDHTQLLPLPSYDQDWYLASQEVQHYGNTAMFHQGVFTTSQMWLPMDQDPATAVIQLDQLPVAEGTNTAPLQPMDQDSATTAIQLDQLPIEEGSNLVPLQPMAPPPKPRKQKAPTLRLDKWEPVKARVIELHISQKLPLPKVKEMVEEEFKSSGFTATIRQYRMRLSQWGLDKNVKPNEMKAIVRKRQQRRLVETDKGELAFEIRGNVVGPEKIDRWMKRNGVMDNTIYAPSPAASTPAALSAWTVSERGSLTPNPANSVGSPTSVAMSRLSSLGLSPSLSSPAPSFSSFLSHKSSAFTGQSPALTHRTISIPETVIMRTDSTRQSFPAIQPQPAPDDSPAVLTEYRYRQEDENRLRHRLSLCETQHGKGHPETLSALQELGRVLREQGRYRSAEQTFRTAVEGCQNYYGNDHVKTISAVVLLCTVLQHQGFFDKAERLLLRIFRTSTKVLGEDHPETLASKANLASTYGNQRRWKEAEELCVQVVETTKRVVGEEHPATLINKANLALTYGNQGRWKDAEELFVQVVETTNRVLGEEHPHTLASKGNLALTYRNQGRWKEAEELEVPALEITKRVLGEEHPHTLTNMDNLALTWKGQGRDKDAMALMKECVQVRERVLGPYHPSTCSSRASLRKWEMEDLGWGLLGVV